MTETQFNKESFLTCEYCGEKMKSSDLSIALALYGGIFLHGNNDGYFGMTCANPKCRKTLFKRMDITSLFKLKSYLFTNENCHDAEENPRFKYRSFPYFTKQHARNKIGIAQVNRYALFKDIQCIDKNELLVADTPDDYYSSICHNDFALGPAIAIWWYKRKYLKQLCHLENKSNVRIFPRYIIDDPLTKHIDDLCWNYDLRIDFLMEMNLPVPSYDVRESLSKRKITKNFSFLNILDMRHSGDIYAMLPSSGDFLVINSGPVSTIARSSDGAPHHAIEGQKPNNKLPPHNLMCETLWENYSKSYLQDLLDKMADDFIHEYIKLNKEPNFTYDDAWSLKQQYLKEIYDYIVSRKKRPVIKQRLSQSTRKVVEDLDSQFPAFKPIVSMDKTIFEIKKRFVKLASNNGKTFDILLLGDSGTGKELFARAYHELTRPGEPYVVVNCGSIPHHLFESLFFGNEKGAFTGAFSKKLGHFDKADGGTLFLDEIGELELSHQARFLRVLENREIQPVGGQPKRVDVQIVFATNRDLYQRVRKNEFREDLYHRINRFPNKIPPLKQRKQDIPLLVDHFTEGFYGGKLKKGSGLQNFTNECLDALFNYDWPGNVRELKNEIERILALRVDDNELIYPSELSDQIKNSSTQGKKAAKKKGRKRNPGKDALLQLKGEGHTHQEIADKFGVARETVTRWYSDIRKN